MTQETFALGITRSAANRIGTTKSLAKYKAAWPAFNLDRREADRLALCVGADIGQNSSACIAGQMSQQGLQLYEVMRQKMLSATTQEQINQARLEARVAFLGIDYAAELPR